MSSETRQDIEDDRCEVRIKLSKYLHDRILKAAQADGIDVSDFISTQMSRVIDENYADLLNQDVAELISVEAKSSRVQMLSLDKFGTPLDQCYMDTSGDKPVCVSRVALDRQATRAVKRALMLNQQGISDALESVYDEFSQQDFIGLLAGPFRVEAD